MRYFVTGGTGFIGSHVVRQLRESGHGVIALVRDPRTPAAARLAALGAELAPGDITEPATLRVPMQGVDGVFHLAAWYEVGTDSRHAEAINVGGTRHVLEMMRELGIPRGVYTSTLAVNSDTGGRRVHETFRYDGPHLSVYDETKWRAHYEVARPMIAGGLPLIIVEPGAVYGPGDTSQLGELMRDAAAGRFVVLPGGRSGLCWAHVEDTARAHLLAMERGERGESYIVAGPSHTYRYAFRAVARAAGRKLLAVFAPPILLRGAGRLATALEGRISLPPEYSAEALRVVAGTTYYGDNTKARKELGFAPRPLDRGLRDTFGDGLERSDR